MLCKIADILTEVPEPGGMAPRCQAYLFDGREEPQITIRVEDYRPDIYPITTQGADIVYMESASQFYHKLIAFDGFYLHASAVELGGRAYLFSGPSGVGKSTHTRLWQQIFGEAAQVFNDDKPALRRLNGKWFAYGTPWCGKDGINQNKKVPLAGICFLKQAQSNRICRLDQREALSEILAQTTHVFHKAENLSKVLSMVEKLLEEIPIFSLENRPVPEAARLSYGTMCRVAEELKL